MAHASPRQIPSWGIRPSSSPQDLRAPLGPPARAEGPPSSRGDSPSLLCIAPLPASLVIEEPPAGYGAGTHSSSHSITTSDSLCANPLVAHPGLDELNTPDIVPPSPFSFPTIADLGGTFMGDDLMDAVLSASKLEDENEERTETCETEQTNSLAVPARADARVNAVNVPQETVSGQAARAEEYPASNSIIIGGAADVILAQPFALNTTATLLTNAPQGNAHHLTPIEDANMDNSETFSNNCVITDVPQSNDGAYALTGPYGMPYNSVSMTNKTSADRSQVVLNLQFSDVTHASEENADSHASNDLILFSGNSEVEHHVTPSASFCCPTDVFSPNALPLNLNSDTYNPYFSTNVNTKTTIQRPYSETQSCMSANQTEDTFLYSSDALPSSVGNLDEMNEDEMKDFDDFCKKITDDDNMEFLSTGLHNEETSNDAAQSSALKMKLDHFGLLNFSQEPGQLLARKSEHEESSHETHRLIDSAGNHLDISDRTLKPDPIRDVDELEMSFGLCDDVFKNLLTGGTDNIGSLPGIHHGSLPGPSVHHVLNKNIDLHDIRAPTPLRRPNTLHNNKKAIDNDELKQKLQQFVVNALQPANVVDDSSNHEAGVASLTDIGVKLQHEQTPRPPVIQHPKFNFDFDPALKVSSVALPQELQPGRTIKVEVMNNKSGLRAPQKPLKRLASSSPAIRTKKFKVVTNSSTSKNVVVSVPVTPSSSGVGLNARSISSGTHIVGGNDTHSSNRTGENIHSESRGNTFELPVASIGTPLYLVRAKPASGESSSKLGRQISNNLVKLNNGNNLHLACSSGSFSASISDRTIRATGTPGQASTVVTGSSMPSVIPKCSLLLAPISSVAAPCKPSSNILRLKSISTVSASSQRDSLVTGSSSGYEAVASTSRAQDKVTYDSDSSDDSFEPRTSGRRGKARTTRVSSSIVGFSRLPRSEQLALDAEKYRKNLKANNLASTKSRLKKKNALLALENEVKEQDQLVVECRYRFEKLKSQYDLMNRMVLSRPCCSEKK